MFIMSIIRRIYRIYISPYGIDYQLDARKVHFIKLTTCRPTAHRRCLKLVRSHSTNS